MYHGIKVAVKEYLARCIVHDVQRVAAFLSHLCHPYVPLIGISTKKMLLSLIMQFHGVNSLDALTLGRNCRRTK